MYGVGLQPRVDVLHAGLAVLALLLDDVGPEQGAAHLANPLVVDLVAGLHVVVAHGLGVVAHVVDDAGREVLVVGHDVVRPVDAGLPLQDVAVVDEQQSVAVLLPLSVDVGAGPGERSLQWALLHEVVGEEVAVYVARLDDLQPHGFLRGLCLCRQCHGGYGCQYECSHLGVCSMSCKVTKINSNPQEISQIGW